MNKDEIFKIQVPIASNIEDNAPAMIYNKDRSIELFVPVDDGIKILMKGAAKTFIHGFIRKGEFVVSGRAPWQDW